MRLIVIGGVAAGMSAASRARRLSSDLDITVLEAGPVVSYGACGLPYWLGGTVTDPEAELIVHTPEFFERERNIRVRTNSPVREISIARRRVVLVSGEEHAFDRLVIATGARARVPVVEESATRPCFPLRTWEDAHRIHRFLAEHSPRSALILGAGYIGLEMAEVLHGLGIAVTMADQSDQLLRWHDPWLTALITEHLQHIGIGIHLGHRVERVGGSVTDEFPADMVILATGVTPASELADVAGIRLGRSGAIAVNEFLETNVQGVFAAGDCAETHHLILDAPAWIPLGTTANKMGRIAGANAVGRRERFPGVIGTSIVRAAGLGVGVVGLSEAAARSAGFSPVAAAVKSRARAKYFDGKLLHVKLVADQDSGRLLGGAVAGEEDVAGRVNTLATAVTAGMTVNEFQFTDLCYAPPYATVWDPLLIAAQQLSKKLV